MRVYEALEDSRDYGLKDQMIRSAVSIPSNVAEGAERGSFADFIRFLRYSKGSAAELRTQVSIANRVGAISESESEELVAELRELSAMLQGLIRAQEQKQESNV